MRREVPPAPRKTSVFFFQHSLLAYRAPGRYPFQAQGNAVDLAGRTVGPWRGTVYADGFDSDTPGPNVDPNVFSEVLPWHLSFCRLSDTKTSSIVAGARRADVLSNLVRAGDVIVFGDTFNLATTWVDTVLCVYGTATIPSVGNRFALEDRFDRYRDEVSEFIDDLTWAQFKARRDFRRNLVDTIDPGGKHTTTGVVPHKQIIGRRAQRVPADRAEILDLLLDGDGFNFIPLRAADAPQLTDNELERERPGLLSFKFELRRQLQAVENAVHLLPGDLGVGLLQAILAASTLLVLDPIEPLAESAR